MSFRSIFSSRSKPLLISLALAQLAVSGCGNVYNNLNPNNRQSCENDFDCPGQKVCISEMVCFGPGEACKIDYDCPGDEYCETNFFCTYQGKETCNDDYDCLEDKICVDNFCQETASSPSYIAKNPTEAWNNFVKSLAEGNLDNILNYVEITSGQRNILKNLDKKTFQEMAEELKKYSLIENDDGHRLKEYYLDNGNQDPVQFKLIKENGQEGYLVYSF